MKACFLLLLACVFLAFPVACEQTDRPPLTVTFIGNEGFLIESAGRKIMVDALFGGFEADWCVVPPDSVVNLMSAARPPFDGVDVITVTHAHVDHFSPEIAAAHMLHNPRGIMICPPQAAEKMAALEDFAKFRDRLRIVPAPGDSAVTFDVAGIEVSALPTRHNVSMRSDSLTGETYDRFADVQHLEYLVDMDGWTIYHSGDSPQYDTAAAFRFGLDRQRIDIAFLQWWGRWNRLSRRQQLVNNILRPDRVIFMHLRPGREIPPTPPDEEPIAREIIVPRYPMESWTFE